MVTEHISAVAVKHVIEQQTHLMLYEAGCWSLLWHWLKCTFVKIKIKVNSHILCCTNAVLLHAMPPRVQNVSFPFDSHIATMFNSHVSCCTCAMPWPCRSESDFSRPWHSTACAWHHTCELASAVQRQHVGNLPAFSFFWPPHGVPRQFVSEAYQSVKL
jgi:hypothetical protein